MVRLLIKKIKKNITLPQYKTDGASGMDLMANIEKTVKIFPGEKKIIPTGIMLAIPNQYEMQICTKNETMETN